jgi:GT2 family glycosyltransferase
MTDLAGAADPWAWARESDSVDGVHDVSHADVTAVIVAHDADRWLPPLLDSLSASSLRPRRVLAVDAGSSDGTADLLAEAQARGRVDSVDSVPAGASFGAAVAAALAVGATGGAASQEWLWLLHDDAVADPDALARLVSTSVTEDAGVVGPLLVEPRRRRGRSGRVSEAGQTITDDGFITGVVAEGVVDQGQLESGPVLGVNACGMLIRRDLWEALGGFDAELPSTVQGLEFSWRARLAGHTVLTQPRARLVHFEASTRGLREEVPTDPLLLRRRWGLALSEAFRPQPLTAGQLGRLRAASTRRMAGYLVGKDFLDAQLERRAIREWRADRASVERLHRAYLDAVGAGDGVPDLDALRLSRRAVRQRRIDETFGRFTDWFSAFGDRGGGLGLEALTGDDFARDDQTRRRLSPTWIVAWIAIVGALAASRTLWATALISGPQLLPVPDSFAGLFANYANPVSGVATSAGAPWTGLLWVASLLTLGHPDVAVSVLLLAAVPLSFVLARRVLGRLLDDRAVALFAAALFALIPALTGAVSAGQLGTVTWALTLPLLANLLLTWFDDRDPAWPVAGGIGLAATVMAAVEPLTWIPIAAAVVLLAVRARGGWPRVAVAAGAPALLLVTPFTGELIRYPGRLLTGAEPLLAPTSAPWAVDLVLGRGVAQAPALWVSCLTFGLLWALAVTGAVLKRRSALWALAVALGCATVAVGLTRVVVPVPPSGLWARPQASAWIVAMAASLIWAAALGLEGLRDSIADSAFDRRHAVVYAALLGSVAAVVVGTGWWVAAGHAGLQRGASELPAFIRKDAARGASRTLALHMTGDQVGWALLSDDLARLGDGERGLAFAGSSDAAALAGSVAKRVAVGAADERIVSDLRRLGVGYLWVTGATTEQRATVSNVPGLGVGAVDDQGANWVVPESGRVMLVTAGQPAKVDPTASIAAGPEGRQLLLAEPSASTVVPRLDGQALKRLPDADGRPAFAVPAAGGTLSLAGPDGFPWWAVVQGLLLSLILALAAPASPSAADARARAPRHARKGRR